MANLQSNECITSSSMDEKCGEWVESMGVHTFNFPQVQSMDDNNYGDWVESISVSNGCG